QPFPDRNTEPGRSDALAVAQSPRPREYHRLSRGLLAGEWGGRIRGKFTGEEHPDAGSASGALFAVARGERSSGANEAAAVAPLRRGLGRAHREYAGGCEHAPGATWPALCLPSP